jgi:hypothetical protein
MRPVELKLKQASAVLGVSPKDLQNLVQLKVIKPVRRESFYRFNMKLLLQAKVAFYLRETLGSSSDLLAKFTEALARDLNGGRTTNARYVSIRSRPASGKDAVEIKIPLRSLARELDQQLPLAAAYGDLPRGRKRSQWKRKILGSLEAAASELQGVTEAQILLAIRKYRADRTRLPEISVVGAP